MNNHQENNSLYNKYINSAYFRVSGYICSAIGIVIGLLLIAVQSVVGGLPLVIVAVSVMLVLLGLFLLLIFSFWGSYKKKEDAEFAKKQAVLSMGGNSIAFRAADTTFKQKILLDVVVDSYTICYRRVKSTNELVVNGYVYDEKKGILEGAHTLIAVIDNHKIEAGFDNTHSFIRFDDELIAQKLRMI